MGFGYKTAWIAVLGRTTTEVADGLSVGSRQLMSYRDGTAAAYASGVFVTPPIDGWTLAHGRDLTDDLNPIDSEFLSWLAAMSTRLGDVQFFLTHRVSECHQWAWARDGRILRAYAVEDMEVPLLVGEPTEVETDLGVGTGTAGSETWDEAQWDAWAATMPDESVVMAVAGRWSVDPSELDDDQVIGEGLFGRLTWR